MFTRTHTIIRDYTTTYLYQYLHLCSYPQLQLSVEFQNYVGVT